MSLYYNFDYPHLDIHSQLCNIVTRAVNIGKHHTVMTSQCHGEQIFWQSVCSSMTSQWWVKEIPGYDGCSSLTSQWAHILQIPDDSRTENHHITTSSRNLTRLASMVTMVAATVTAVVLLILLVCYIKDGCCCGMCSVWQSNIGMAATVCWGIRFAVRGLQGSICEYADPLVLYRTASTSMSG